MAIDGTVILEISRIYDIICRMTKADRFFSAQNKLASYDNATFDLMDFAGNFQDAYSENFTLPEMVYLLRNSFKQGVTHRDVLGEPMNTNEDRSRGFCMISSYLIYSMTGGDKVWELQGTNLHWWLYHKQSHQIFDITHTQFDKRTLYGHYKYGQPVTKLKTDLMFFDVLKDKAQILARRAGLAKRE